jgi:hypothetical protein
METPKAIIAFLEVRSPVLRRAGLTVAIAPARFEISISTKTFEKAVPWTSLTWTFFGSKVTWRPTTAKISSRRIAMRSVWLISRRS